MQLRLYHLDTRAEEHRELDAAWLLEADTKNKFVLQRWNGDEWISIPVVRQYRPRPWHFILVLWGAQHRDYFTDWCLPSLLAPKNVPALSGRGHKLVIACPIEEWAYLCKHPTVKYAQQWLAIDRVPFERPAQGENACVAMRTGHKEAALRAFRDEAIGVHITPDLLISDGLILTAEQHLKNGAKVVLTLALRFWEEKFFHGLKRIGHQRCERKQIALEPRKLVHIAMNSMHPETRSYEWGKEIFAKFPSSVWTPISSGMACCGLSWLPIMFDYGALRKLDTKTLDDWTMDGDYVYRNFGDGRLVKHISDSDDGVLISWTSCPDREISEAPWSNAIERERMFSKAFNHASFDPLKRKLFWQPVMWHAEDLNSADEISKLNLLDNLGRSVSFDWRRMCFVNEHGETTGILEEDFETYSKKSRHG